MRPWRLVLLALACVLAASGVASAEGPTDTIEEARERWFEADFEASLAAFEAVLARRELTATEALDAHRYLAALNQLLGDEEAARAHADAAVALDPSVGPPEGSPPEARDLFSMARRRIGGRAATIAIEAPEPLSIDAPGRVAARVEPSPSALFSRLRLRCAGEEAEAAAPRVELAVVPSGDFECTAEATSAGGAVLRSAHQDFDLGARAGAASAGEEGRRVWPWALAGSIVAAAAVGTIIGVLVARDDGDPELVGTTVVGW